MSRIRLTLLAVAAAAALSVAAPTQAATPVKLNATVGPGFTISLKTLAGKKVTTLKPGVYSFVVSDKSRFHNWHLKGGPTKLNRQLTTVAFVGTKTVTLTLRAGSYQFVCTPHASMMKGAFRVG
jgi:plastocyanin